MRVVAIQSCSVVKGTVTLPSSLNFESSEASCAFDEQHCNAQTASIKPKENIRCTLTPRILIFTIANTKRRAEIQCAQASRKLLTLLKRVIVDPFSFRRVYSRGPVTAASLLSGSVR